MQKTNIMQSETIPRLLFKMSFPMMLSMLIQALYNVVDSIFVAMVSETALTAVSLAFPLQNLLISAAVGTGVGINSLLSRRLGEGKHEEANHVASTSLFLAFAMWVLFVLIGVFLTKPFLALFTKDTELLKLSTSYSRICLIVSFGCIFSITIEKLIQATGNSVQPMTMQLTGAITNIILDPVFIFVFGLGVNGAAIATVIGQIASMLLAIIFFKKNEYISIKFKDIKPNARIIKDIFQVGLPSIIMNSIGTVMVSLINKILILFSATAVSVFGVYFKLQSFVFMPVFGLNNGVIPILGFNYGARNKNSTDNSNSIECSKTLSNHMLSTLTVSDVITASIDSTCNSIRQSQCSNYNYLASRKISSMWTFIADSDNSYRVYTSYKGKVLYKDTNDYYNLYVTVKLSPEVLYLSGDGSEENPYKIVEN